MPKVPGSRLLLVGPGWGACGQRAKMLACDKARGVARVEVVESLEVRDVGLDDVAEFAGPWHE